MSSALSSFSRIPAAFFLVVAISTIAAMTGCGSKGSSTAGGPTFSGNTSVNVLISSTANDQLSRFDIELQSLKLTDQSGTVIELLPATQGLEFMHVNGGIEPLLTVRVPQGIYSGATATVGTAEFTCVTLTPTGGLDTSIFAYGQTPAENIKVNLREPITITGTNMSVGLNLLVSESAALSSCYAAQGQYTYSITPTFELAPISLASQPTNATNGKVMSLDGRVTSIDLGGNTFALSLPQDLYIAPTEVSIKSGNGTTYDGISGLSGLAAGMLVDIDGAIRADGSVAATRIAVLDADTTNLSMQTGPVMQTNSSVPLVVAFGQRQQGYLYDMRLDPIWIPYDYSGAVFEISGNFSNLLNLPFLPSFNSSNMVDGQNVYVTSHASQVTGNPYTPTSSIMLFPQTINGSVVAASTSGGFTVYTVTLADYSLFPQLAVQAGQATLLNNPGEVQVYTDSNTQKVNTTPLAPGSTLRFYGLVFNDNGTLRMDCAQVSDGVASTAQANSRTRMRPGCGADSYSRRRGGSAAIDYFLPAIRVGHER